MPKSVRNFDVPGVRVATDPLTEEDCWCAGAHLDRLRAGGRILLNEVPVALAAGYAGCATPMSPMQGTGSDV